MNENNSKKLSQDVVRTGASRNNGFSANGLQNCDAVVNPMLPSEIAKATVNASIQPTIKTTYQDDYGPKGQRDETIKVPQQSASKKWNRDIGFSANSPQNYDALVKAIRKTEMMKSNANENTQTTYQHDFGPIEHRDQCDRNPKRKLRSTRNGLCKCGKTGYKAEDPNVYNYQISPVKCTKNYGNSSISNDEKPQSQAQNSYFETIETQKKSGVCSVYQSDYRDYSKVFNYLAYNATGPK